MNAIEPCLANFRHTISGDIHLNSLCEKLASAIDRYDPITPDKRIGRLFRLVFEINQTLINSNNFKWRESWSTFLASGIKYLEFTPFISQLNEKQITNPINATRLHRSDGDYVYEYFQKKLPIVDLDQMLSSENYFVLAASAGPSVVGISFGKKIEFDEGAVLYFHVSKAYSCKRYVTLDEFLGPFECNFIENGIDAIVFLDSLQPFSTYNHYASKQYKLLDVLSYPIEHVSCGLFYKSISNRKIPLESIKRHFSHNGGAP